MSVKPYKKNIKNSIFRFVSLILLFVTLSACEGLGSKKSSNVDTPTSYNPSSRAIIYASQADIVFAQTALNKLGYQVGRVDGIWGPKSARAIRHFESLNQIQTANGHLSELNLNTLESVSLLKRSDKIPANPYKPRSISAQIDRSVPLEKAPQLIILNKAYSIHSKPNPYSELLTSVEIGSGIYVIALQDGWYKVETKNNVSGYIRNH